MDSASLLAQIPNDTKQYKQQKEKLRNDINEIIAKEAEKLHKVRIRIDKSRNVFGVCDTSGKLEYGQVSICL